MIRIAVIENPSLPDFCWLEAFENDESCENFIQNIGNKYSAPTPYNLTRKIELNSDHSLAWVRFRLRMAFFRFQTDRDPRELNVSSKRLAKILELILPCSPNNPGQVYVLVNQGLEGLMKIGITRRSVITRTKELQSTGVPGRFVCIYAAKVDNPEEIENRLLNLFDRPSKNREFIKTGVDISWLLQFHQVKEVTPQKFYSSTDNGNAYFDSIPFQGIFNTDYIAIDTRINFFNERQLEIDLADLGFKKDASYFLEVKQPLICLSFAGYKYLMKQHRLEVKNKLKQLYGKHSDKSLPLYEEDKKNIFKLKKNLIPNVMGETIIKEKHEKIQIYPLKHDAFLDVMKSYGIGDIPYYSKQLCKKVFFNFEEMIISENTNVMERKSINDTGFLYDEELYQRVKNRTIC